jgi:acetone carboxylase gamma subunit
MPTSRASATSAVAQPHPNKDSFVFKCEKCGHEFSVKVSDIPQVKAPADQINALTPDCPECGAKKSCFREMECPNCHKMFIGAGEKEMVEAFRKGRPPRLHVHDICPYCATDVQDWWKNHPRGK